MQILDHTDDHPPTLIRDVFENLIGHKVYVYAKGQDNSFAGILVAYNGFMLHVLGANNINYYMHTVDVAVIGSDK
jgi:hypothetical protein